MAAADSTSHEEPLIPPAGGSVLSAPVRYWSTVLLPLLLAIPAQMASRLPLVSIKRLLRVVGVGGTAQDTPSLKNTPQYKLGFNREKITTNLELYSPDQAQVRPPGQRRLVLLYVWLTAKPRHIRKYSKLLTDLGLHVLVVRSYFRNFVNPTTGSQMVGESVCNYLREHSQDYDKLFVYGCSVGAYVFCETMTKLRKDSHLHGRVIPKFVGQIWDSPVDLEGSALGFAHSITDRAILQTIIAAYADWLLKICHHSVTRHYKAASQVMYSCPVRVPCFYFYSSNDPMSLSSINLKVAKIWEEEIGIPVNGRIFDHDSTGHCLNFATYPEEYTRLVYRFMERVGMAEDVVVEKALKEQGYFAKELVDNNYKNQDKIRHTRS